MKVISIMIHKGGQTKTTTAMHLGYALHKKKNNVLLIDLDPNAGMTRGFGFGNLCDAMYLFENKLLTVSLNDKSKYKFDLVRSWSNLSTIDLMKIGLDKIKKVLHKHKLLYDYCIIDCFPSDTNLALSALEASQYLVIPCVPDKMGWDSLNKTISFIKESKTKQFAVKLEILGILLNNVIRWKVHKQYTEKIRNQYTDLVFEVSIPQYKAMPEAQERDQLIYQYDPKHKLSLAYNEFTKEFLKRIR